MAKFVRAKRNGFWDGNRRRAGSIFPVADNAKESWFEDVGPAPAGTQLPEQIQTAQAPPPKSFTQVMKELGEKTAAQDAADTAKAAAEIELAQRTLAQVSQNAGIDDGSVSDLT